MKAQVLLKQDDFGSRDTNRFVLVLSGNLLCPTTLLDSLAPALRASGYKGIAVDWLPFAGHHALSSIAAMLTNELEMVAPRSAVLLGHSTGGVLAQLCAVSTPAALRGLILTNTGASMENHGEARDSFFSGRKWNEELIREFLTRCHGLALPAATTERLVSYAMACEPQDVLHASQTLREIDARRLLRQISVPVQVVHGEMDTARTLADAQEMQTNIPQVRIATLPCGHTPPLELPEAFNRITQRFLESLA